MYLIHFTYTGYCQGPEDMTETVLVKKAASFKAACQKIKAKYSDARDFKDLTIE